MSATDWTVILRGMVGSHAYGLATPESDRDYLAFAMAPTEQFLGMSPPVGKHATRVSHEPDLTVHELGKACSLLLKCNPSVLELLWLDEYAVCTLTGADLITLRHAFLSARAVRNAFFGYAQSQFSRLVGRGDGTFSSDVRRRTAKHARHLHRLLHQGFELYSTGTMTVRLENPDACRAFGDIVANDPKHAPEVCASLLSRFEYQFDRTRPAIPEQPYIDTVERWLRSARRRAFVEVPITGA